MTTETKKSEKEHSVEERLQALYQLQTLLSEVDKIKTLRGELPNEVKDCEDEIERYKLRIAKHNDEIAMLGDSIRQLNGAIDECRMKVDRYNEQINNVRNNREYAFLEKEREYQTLEIELNEKKILMEEEALTRDKVELEDHCHILDTKKKELEEIVSETRAEEESIMKQAKDLEHVIDDYTLAAFKRIRKNARNGLGIVTVQRDACGGCFNRIPPQRQLEIKMHKKVIVCEYCGRIMIDAQLAGVEETPAPAPVKTRARAKKSAK